MAPLMEMFCPLTLSLARTKVDEENRRDRNSKQCPLGDCQQGCFLWSQWLHDLGGFLESSVNCLQSSVDMISFKCHLPVCMETMSLSACVLTCVMSSLREGTLSEVRLTPAPRPVHIKARFIESVSITLSPRLSK